MRKDVFMRFQLLLMDECLLEVDLLDYEPRHGCDFHQLKVEIDKVPWHEFRVQILGEFQESHGIL